MKLVMFGEPYLERPGALLDDKLVDLEVPELDNPHSLEEILAWGDLARVDEYLDHLPRSTGLPLQGIRFGPPLSGVGKIIAVGLNYRQHAEEMGDALPARPLLFAKASSAISGPADPLMLPPTDWAAEIDYEVELGVVIAHQCHAVSPEDALAYVAGYTIVNDVTARDIQRAESQWFRAKSYDGFCPIGPYLLTADEVPDPNELALCTRVNGEVRQRSSTADMIFTVPQLVSFISHAMTLMPGDLIATGTPSGIGAGMKPPRYLQPGDRVEMEIELLAHQAYPVIAHSAER